VDLPDVIPLAAPLIKSEKPLDFFGRLRPVVRNDFVGPTTGAGATAKVTLRLTRGELLALDRYSARKENYPQPGRAGALKAGFSTTVDVRIGSDARSTGGETGLATPRR
jgi:hypothetical protein